MTQCLHWLLEILFSCSFVTVMKCIHTWLHSLYISSESIWLNSRLLQIEAVEHNWDFRETEICHVLLCEVWPVMSVTQCHELTNKSHSITHKNTFKNNPSNHLEKTLFSKQILSKMITQYWQTKIYVGNMITNSQYILFPVKILFN